MSLTPPSSADLLVHMRESDWVDAEEEAYAAVALQQAADLMQIATGIDTDPTDPLHLRVMKMGMLDMAWAILIQSEDKEESFSPYSSERIGSYSYQKRGPQDIIQGSGVQWFDYAVNFFLSLGEADGKGLAWIETEQVFTRKADAPELDIPPYDYAPWFYPPDNYR